MLDEPLGDDGAFLEDLRMMALPPTDEQIAEARRVSDKIRRTVAYQKKLNEAIQSWPILVIRDLPLPGIVRVYLMGAYLWLRGFRDAGTG